MQAPNIPVQHPPAVANMSQPPQAPYFQPILPRRGKDPAPRPRKLRRITRACDYCHKRSIKCQPSEENEKTCQNCVDFAVPCTYERPAKKRGTKSSEEKMALRIGDFSSNDEKRDAQMLLELTNGGQLAGSLGGPAKAIPEKWKVMMEANEAKIRGLVDVYFEVVYPMYVPLMSRSLDFICFIYSVHVTSPFLNG